MFCEDQSMSSVKNSPTKTDKCSFNESGSSSISSDMKPLVGSWAEEMQRDERRTNDKNLPSSSENSLTEGIDGEECQKRELALEFLDNVNGEKFERLVKEEKLRTPFKRRHSHTPPSNASRSESPNSSSSEEESQSSTNWRPKNNSQLNEKRFRLNSQTSSTSSSTAYTETNPAVLARRQKQIDYGKNTVAYDRYVAEVARSERTRDSPSTPDKYGKYSRRAFDGLVKIWRKKLHQYDPPNQQTAVPASSDSDSDSD